MSPLFQSFLVSVQLLAFSSQLSTEGYRPQAVAFRDPSLQPLAYSLKSFLFLLKADG